MTSERMLERLAALAREKRGEDLVALDVRELVEYMDALLVVTARSERQNRAIAENIIRGMKQAGILPLSRRGNRGRHVDLHRLRRRGRAPVHARPAQDLRPRAALGGRPSTRPARTRARRRVARTPNIHSDPILRPSPRERRHRPVRAPLRTRRRKVEESGREWMFGLEHVEGVELLEVDPPVAVAVGARDPVAELRVSSASRAPSPFLSIASNARRRSLVSVRVIRFVVWKMAATLLSRACRRPRRSARNPGCVAVRSGRPGPSGRCARSAPAGSAS